ncbi:7808_t:CDS:2 [Funneliformis geosporum]|uniref:7808_t:CDS:1 n=1 Tax=Funneliformis geosporum TaxID=1117311 RepID=A0A9W4SS38_9GLOM|nr:7808_t:CDS:2 [Funneliformis geosporum]
MEEESTTVKCKTYVQTKLSFPTEVYNGPSAEKKIQKDYSTLYAKAKQEIKPKIQDKIQSNRKIPSLDEFLKDSKLEKISDRQQHLETNMHKNNVIYEKSNPSKRLRTTFLNFESKQKEILDTDTGMHSESSKKVCYGYYSKSFAVLAQYGTSMNNYKILRDDNLFDKKIKTYGYIKSNKCEEYTTSKYCFKCDNLAQLDAIDCLLLLKEGQHISASIISQFGNSWIQFDVKKLYDTVISSLKNRPGNTRSTELQQLFKYVEKEMSDYSYYTTINKYPALGHIIEAVETNGLENWIGQSITKVIDKMQRDITTMRGIGEYHESFIDFLIVLMSISTLATRWLTANLAGPTIRFLRRKRNESDIYYNIYGINTSSFSDIITIWREAYNYAGPTICAKDQTKVAELIEVCRHRQK